MQADAPKSKEDPFVPVLTWTNAAGVNIDTVPPARKRSTRNGDREVSELVYDVEVAHGLVVAELDEVVGLPLPANLSRSGSVERFHSRHRLPGSENSRTALPLRFRNTEKLFLEMKLAISGGRVGDEVLYDVCGAQFSLKIERMDDANGSIARLTTSDYDQAIDSDFLLGARVGVPVATPTLVIEIDKTSGQWSLFAGDRVLVEKRALAVGRSVAIETRPRGAFDELFVQEVFIHAERPKATFRERRANAAEEKRILRLEGHRPEESRFQEALKAQRAARKLANEKPNGGRS